METPLLFDIMEKEVMDTNSKIKFPLFSFKGFLTLYVSFMMLAGTSYLIMKPFLKSRTDNDAPQIATAPNSGVDRIILSSNHHKELSIETIQQDKLIEPQETNEKKQLDKTAKQGTQKEILIPYNSENEREVPDNKSIVAANLSDDITDLTNNESQNIESEKSDFIDAPSGLEDLPDGTIEKLAQIVSNKEQLNESQSSRENRDTDTGYRKYYTIQTGSYAQISNASNKFESLIENLPDNNVDSLRIEKIGDFYSVRVGKFEDFSTAEKYLKTNGPKLPESIILKSFIKNKKFIKSYNHIEY